LARPCRARRRAGHRQLDSRRSRWSAATGSRRPAPRPTRSCSTPAADTRSAPPRTQPLLGGGALASRMSVPGLVLGYRLGARASDPAASTIDRRLYRPAVAGLQHSGRRGGDSAGAAWALVLAVDVARTAGYYACRARPDLPVARLVPDLDGSRAHAPREPVLTRKSIASWAAAYVAGADARLLQSLHCTAICGTAAARRSPSAGDDLLSLTQQGWCSRGQVSGLRSNTAATTVCGRLPRHGGIAEAIRRSTSSVHRLLVRLGARVGPL